MAKRKAFSVVEILVIMFIIGIITAISIPIIVKDTRTKITNMQYYEVYKALYEGSKRAKILSPTHDFRITRANNFKQLGVCDLFTQIFSLSISDTNSFDIKTCPEGELDVKTGLCNSCTYTLPGTEECPMDISGKRIKYCDDKCSPCDINETPSFCRVAPSYVKYYSGCDDGTTVPVTERDITKLRKLTFTNTASAYNDSTNFDKVSTNNFITSNGLTFYGLEKYPQKGDIDFRNVYIDADGQNVNRIAKKCRPCVADNDNPENEANTCREMLDCLKNEYGIYKFRLYDDGHIEPMTNRKARNTKMYFKLYYVKNGKIQEAPKMFGTYDSARKYMFDAPQKFRYLSVEENEQKWVDEMVSRPCYHVKDFVKFKCDIVPVVPEIKAVRVKR